jgi:hypothetical protein
MLRVAHFVHTCLLEIIHDFCYRLDMERRIWNEVDSDTRVVSDAGVAEKNFSKSETS